MDNNGSDPRNHSAQQMAAQNAQNCGQGMLGWGQQISYGPPPTAEQQLTARAFALTSFLAIDHDKKRAEAQAELDRINAALAALKVPE